MEGFRLPIFGLVMHVLTSLLMVTCITEQCPAIPLPDSTFSANQPAAGDHHSATDMASSTLRVLGASFVVFAAIFALAYALKRLGFRQDRAASHVPIRVIGTRSLGPKRGIYVIETLGRILVIGMTEHNLTLLTEMHDLPSLEEADVNFERAGGSPLKFADFLNGWLVKLPGKIARNENHKS